MTAVAPEGTVDLLDGDLYAGDPDPIYAWLRVNRPVYRDEVNKLWGISRHADIHAIECDPSTFSSASGSRPGVPAQPSMIDSDDPAHAERRKLVYRRFTPRAVVSHEPVIRHVARELVQAAVGQGEVDAVPALAAPLPARMIARLLGFDEQAWPRMVHWSETTIPAGGGPRYLNDEAVIAAAEYAGEVLTLAEQRRQCPADDLMSVWTTATIGGEPLPEQELCSEALLLLDGGAETTRTVIATSLDAFARFPEQWQTLRAEPSLVPHAVEELIRWTTPILNMARTATRDVVVHGERINAGDEVLLMYSSANRDEKVFSDPQRFDVRRWPNPHLAFGLGTHFCLGAALARLELRVMVEELLPRVAAFEWADDIGPRRMRGAFVRGITSFPLRLVPA